MKVPALLLFFGAVSAPGLAAQMGAGSSTAGSSPNTVNDQTDTRAKPDSPTVARPVYISGKVAMQDGSPVPPSVTIQRICSGMTKIVAYTDSRGRFSFQWNNGNEVISDASDAGSPRVHAGFGGSQSAGAANPMASDPYSSRIMNCQLRANAAGFTSDAVNLVNRRTGDDPDIGLIVLRRIPGIEGTSVSVTSMMAPKDARKAYEQGLQSVLKNKPADAEKEFEKAVAVYPNYADAWVSLGKLRLRRQSVEPGRTALLKAIELDPKLIVPYLELGFLSVSQAKWQASADYMGRAVELDPVDFPEAWYANAVANYNLGKYDAAEKSAREAVKLDPRHANPRSGYLLGLVLAEKHDFAGAAAELKTYMQLAPGAPDAAQVKDQLAQLEKLMGQSKQASASKP
jgi:tetratricopeptide (TPR) repeat protein